MNSISTFDITKYPLLDILKDIKIGRIQLPDFQRDWVWNDAQVRRVLASVSLAYPIGAVMMLQQSNHQVQFKPRLVDGITLPEPLLPNLLILDGQQRLTTLFMVLLSEQPVWVKDSKSNKLSRKWYYLDIEKALDPNTDRTEAIFALPESKILRSFNGHIIDASTPQQEFLAGLFPLSKVFFLSEWRSHYSQFWQYDPEKLKLIDTLELEVLKKFEHYQMPVIQLRDSLPKEAVCQVFEDTNTSGCDLNFFDLMTASYCADNFSLRDDWKHREASLKSFKVLRLLKNTDFMQAVTLVATYARRQSAIETGSKSEKLPAVTCRRSDILKLSKEEYQRWAQPVTKGFEEAARFLHTQKIFDASHIGYPIQLVSLAAILTILGKRKSSEQTRSALARWLWCGMFGEMYTGGHEARAAHDVLEVTQWLSGGSLPTTITSADFSVRRLVGVRKRYGAVYQGLSALLRRSGAIDWSTGEEINDVLYFEQRVESHHIFPVAWCKKQGIEPKKYNCLVNRTPLSASTNKKIGSKSPEVYLSQFEKLGTSSVKLDEMLRSHAIDPATLRHNDFEAFFTARILTLMDLISMAMGKSFTIESFEGTYEEYKNSNGNGWHQSLAVNY
ncbi:GmrSD restriction endonuclease domain-containing protein [Lyngbya aestuarii]|uniref:GmrSD restriction endonuclease domain-containing protein n=1 Tax=Lyngbya aestuarii TaxID=118322 RepID=UPI00403DDDF9